jgi:hypothetical protein
VWKREPYTKQLPIRNGWIVQDDNLLACGDHHIKSVFAMLARQSHRAEFSGGLEARLLKPWHVELLAWLRPAQMFFAYDEPADYEPLVFASRMLRQAGFTRQQMRCYVLIGGPRDTQEKAEKRLRQTIALGFFPQSMLYHDNEGKTQKGWTGFMRNWARPAIIARCTSPTPQGEQTALEDSA